MRKILFLIGAIFAICFLSCSSDLKTQLDMQAEQTNQLQAQVAQQRLRIEKQDEALSKERAQRQQDEHELGQEMNDD